MTSCQVEMTDSQRIHAVRRVFWEKQATACTIMVTVVSRFAADGEKS